MVVTLGQQYNVGEKPTVILYTYINRHAGTPDKKQNRNRNNVVHPFNMPNSGCGKERRISFGLWNLPREVLVWNYLEVYWACAGGLSAVNAIGTQLIKSGRL